MLMVGWLKCCFTSTEIVGLLGTGAQDGHLDFHTVRELWFGLGYIRWACADLSRPEWVLGRDLHKDAKWMERTARASSDATQSKSVSLGTML